MGIEDSISSLLDMVRSLVIRISKFDNDYRSKVVVFDDRGIVGCITVSVVPRVGERVEYEEKSYTVSSVVHGYDFRSGRSEVRVYVVEV